MNKRMSIIRTCQIHEIPVGHYFLRGRGIYQVTNKKGADVLARKVKPIKLSYITFGPEKKVMSDRDEEVVYINFHGYKIVQNESEIM
jgi:hypothetical protein